MIQFRIINDYIYPSDIPKPIKFFDGEYIKKRECKDTKILLGGLESTELIQLNQSYELVDLSIRNKILIGYFSTSQQVKFGKNKKGATIYLVDTLEPNFPKFLVSYKGKERGLLCIKFKFTNWNEDLPSGNLIDVISNYSEDNSDLILMNYYNIYPKGFKAFNKKLEDSIDSNPNEKEINRINLTNGDSVYQPQYIFSIDPDGSEDIDDALSFQVTDTSLIVGVHIAQPTYWLSLKDIIKKAASQISTIYAEKQIIHLYGDKLTSLASLKEGQIKPAYSTFFKFNKKDINSIKGSSKVESIESFPSLIMNNKNYSYNEINNMCFRNDLSDFENNIVSFTNFTKELIEYKFESSKDIVSYWMIKCNEYIGNKILKEGKYNIPYRITYSTELNEFNFSELSPDISKLFRDRINDTAKYELDAVKDNFEHRSLGVKNYCHFTSPIRRIVDSYIHYILTYGNTKYFNKELEETEEFSTENLNELDTRTKRFHSQIEFKKAYKINNDILSKVWIYKIISKNYIEIYIEELKIFKKASLYHPKFEKIFESNERLRNIVNQTKEGDSFEIEIKFQINPIPKRKIMPIYLLNSLLD